MVSVPINRYDNLGKYIDTWKSESTAAKVLGLSLTTINKVIMGYRNTCNGYIFKKVSEYPMGKDLEYHIKSSEVLVIDIDTNTIVSEHKDAKTASVDLNIKSVMDVYKKCENIIIFKKNYYLIHRSNYLKEDMECKWRKILKHSKRLRMYISNGNCKVCVQVYQSRNDASTKLNLSLRELNKILKDPKNPKNKFEIVEECRLVDFGYIKPIKCN